MFPFRKSAMPTTWILCFVFVLTTVETIHKETSSFRRSSVELVPWEAAAGNHRNNSSSAFETLSESFSLPNRLAVEKVPTLQQRAEEHFPLRDAVERVPPINSYLEQLNAQYLQKQTEVKDAYRVVCFMSSYSWYRKIETQFTPDYVDPHLCTHIVYAFASLNPNNYTIMSADPVIDFENNFYKKITSPDVINKAKVLLSIGGWTDSAGDKYSKLVSSGTNRRRFVNSVVAFLRRYNYQGLHFDWYYPVCWQARCSEMQTSDRTNFAKLIQELRNEFDKQNPRFELAIGVSGYKEIIDVGYDILNLNENVDFMSVMTFDYHGAWENRTGHISPLFYSPHDQFPEYNTDSTLSSLVLLGADPNKVVMGIPFYGQSFTLANSKHHDLGDDAVDAGEPGEYTQQPGVLSYYEICTRIKKQGWRTGRNRNYSTEAFAYKGNQWVGYDDKESLRAKINYMKKSRYGGVMTWTLDMDDYNNECCTGVYPLLRTINAELGRITRSSISEFSDCTKPVIITTLATNSTTMGTTSAIEETTLISTTNPGDYTSSWTSTTQSTSTSTFSSYSTQPWWPPSLTTRPTVSHRPRPTSAATGATPTMSSKRRTTVRSTYPVTTSTTQKPSTTSAPEETTPSNVPQCEPGMYYTDSTNCGSYFICVYGKKKRRQCAPGLHWNIQSENCDWPSRANCLEHIVSTAQSTSESTTTKTTTTEMSTQSSTTAQPDRPSAVVCIDAEHYAVPGDCSSFYVCDGGRLYKRRCPGGLSWNRRNRLCDWMYNAPCDENYNADPSLTLRKESPKKSEKLSMRPEVPPRKAGTHKNGNKCDSGQFTRHVEDCNKYYQCLWGAYKETRCPPGLFWNKQMFICDWPNNVDCETPDAEEGEEEVLVETTSRPSPTTESTTIEQFSSSQTTQTPWWTPWTEPSSSASWGETPSSTFTTSWWSETSPSTSSPSAWWSETQSSSSSSSWTNTPSTAWSWSETPWTPSTTTAATLPTTKPPKPLTGYYKVVCYFTNWAWYRPGAGKYFPEDTDPNLCTHVIYGFAVLDYERLVIKVYDSWADIDNKFYERLASLKRRGVKVSVAIGGWNDSAGDKYSRLVNSESARRNFVSAVLRFIKQYGFDGLDLDWEYPKCWQVNCNQGPDSDKEGFSALVTELRQAFDVYGYLLSAAVSPSKTVIDKGYDVKLLSDNLDWIGVMTYDYHGQWDKKTGHLAPIYHIPGDDYDFFNVNYSINYWIEKGAEPRKLVMGMPMYGQGFTLADASKHDLNAPSYGPSHAGEYTRAGGFLAYYEICQKVRNEQWTVVQDPLRRRGPYAYKGDQWVGYDDLRTIKQKVNLIKKFGLGGGMIWALDLDDFRNLCGQGYYPLLTTIAEGLANAVIDNEDHYVTGVDVTWSTIKGPSITGMITNRTTTKSTPIYTSTKKHRTKTTPTTTSATSTTPSSTYSEITDVISAENTIAGSIPSSISAPPSNEQTDHFKVVCYFTNWAWYRQGVGKYLINDIDPDLCTHIIYAFAVLDSGKLIIKPHDAWADLDNQFYEKVVTLKNRGIKVLLAIGGWNDSAGNKYSRLVNSKQSRERFISHAVEFIKKYGFDGLDVDWEYPKCWQVNCKLGPSSDKKAFADFITELREEFNEHGLLLSAAVSPNRRVIDEGYDVPLLNEKLDWISVMVYDYHGQWDNVTGHVAPMYVHPDDTDKTFNANYSMHYWVEKGADPRKLVMGMPMYGQSFTLASAKNNTLNSRVYGGGEAGESTRARGFLAFYEICDRILRKGWDVQYDIEGRMGPYAIRGTQWVSFDDQAMIKHKSQYVFYNNLGGAMIWALDLDDFKGVCNCGTYPLLKTINKILRNYEGDVPECNLESNTRADVKLFYQNEGVELLGEEWRFENCEHGQVKEHPTDCSKYLSCTFGVYQQEKICPDGLHFNQKSGMCDWPQNADCKPSIMQYAEAYFLNSLQKQTTQVDNKTDSNYKIMCYLTNWSSYRYNNQLFPVQALDSNLCTHMVYGFAVLDPQTLTIKSNDTFVKLDNEFFKRVRVLKETGVKISLALGGWFDSMDDKYSRLVNSRSARTQFIKHAVKFLREHEFDGLEIDWEYPKCWQADCNRGQASDKNGFTTLMRELREVFWKHNLLLSAAVSSSRDIIDNAYDVPVIASYVDWLSLMAYDYHGFWEGKTDHIAPLHRESNNSSNYLNVESSVSYWIEKGAPSDKLILGIPFYGQSFTLKNSTNHKIGSKVVGPGNAGRHTRVPGFLAFYEICEMVSQGNWKIVKDKNGHYVHKQNQWISYNDVSDVKLKGKYVKENNLGGILAWSLDLDDFVNVCGCGANPLLTAINEELSQFSYRTQNSGDCTK